MTRHEMRALGRVGQPLSGGSYRPRRRLRAPRWLFAVVALLIAGIVWVGIAADRQVAGPVAGDAAQLAGVPGRPAADLRASRSQQRADAEAFAFVDGLPLGAPHPSPLAIAFHEASRAEALALDPSGVLAANENPSVFTPPADVAGGLEYRVLPSRGRGRPATSAVDVLVPLGDAVSSPVTGTVTRVVEYPLYGRIRDWRVEVQPTDRPDLTVVLIHLLRPSVRVGEAVTAGRSPLGVARLLPFDSQVDAFSSSKNPHTHIEVKASVAPEAIDPNQPAAPADDEAETTS